MKGDREHGNETVIAVHAATEKELKVRHYELDEHEQRRRFAATEKELKVGFLARLVCVALEQQQLRKN